MSSVIRGEKRLSCEPILNDWFGSISAAVLLHPENKSTSASRRKLRTLDLTATCIMQPGFWRFQNIFELVFQKHSETLQSSTKDIRRHQKASYGIKRQEKTSKGSKRHQKAAKYIKRHHMASKDKKRHQKTSKSIKRHQKASKYI